ncbi:hypothetical protein KJ966_23475 [bacterium]|nr:hypothetical protein [bacterium]
MMQASKKTAPSGKQTEKKKKSSSAFNISELAAQVESEFDPNAAGAKKKEKAQQPHRTTSRITGSDDLDPIDPQIPYNRRFLKNRQSSSGSEEKGEGLIGRLGSNVKGLIGNFRVKEMEKEKIIELRKMIGHLKDTKVTSSTAATTPITTAEDQKTKAQLLKESRKKINANAKLKEEKKDKNIIGLRNEIEKLKKRYPNDDNLVILDSILTTRDGCLIHRTTEERVSSLTSALREAAKTVANQYLTTYSIEVVIEIYFLYLEALKKLFLDKLRKISGADIRPDPIAVESLRRDIRVLNVLLEQHKLKKTISNIAQKLHGFGYPFIAMTPMLVSKTFSSSSRDDNEKVGPGTIKLNKFLIRIYLNVFAQIPIFQPIAQKICDALPDEYMCKVLIANVNMDNAYTQLKISKAAKDSTLGKQTLALFNFGKHFIETNIKDSASTASEGRILLRTAEMAEEYAFTNDKVDANIVKYGYKCANMAISFYEKEVEGIIRRLYEVADIKKIDLQEPIGSVSESR